MGRSRCGNSCMPGSRPAGGEALSASTLSLSIGWTDSEECVDRCAVCARSPRPLPVAYRHGHSDVAAQCNAVEQSATRCSAVRHLAGHVDRQALSGTFKSAARRCAHRGLSGLSSPGPPPPRPARPPIWSSVTVRLSAQAPSRIRVCAPCQGDALAAELQLACQLNGPSRRPLTRRRLCTRPAPGW
jgi:hypothetical protein